MEQEEQATRTAPVLEETPPSLPPLSLSETEAAFLCYKAIEVGRPDWKVQQIARAGFRIEDPVTKKIVYVVATEVQG